MVSVAKIGWSIVILLVVIIGAFFIISDRLIDYGPMIIPPVYVNATLLGDISEYGFPMIRIDSVEFEGTIYCLEEGDTVPAFFEYGLEPVRILYRSIPYERVDSGPNEGARIGRPPITTRDEEGNIVITSYSDREINREEYLPGLENGSRFSVIIPSMLSCEQEMITIKRYMLIEE